MDNAVQKIKEDLISEISSRIDKKFLEISDLIKKRIHEQNAGKFTKGNT